VFMICFAPLGVVGDTFPRENASKGEVRLRIHRVADQRIRPYAFGKSGCALISRICCAWREGCATSSSKH